MATTNLLDRPDAAWAPHDPATDGPWDLARVAHLHRRAGFSAPWAVLQRDLADGPGASVSRLLAGEAEGLDGQPASKFAADHDAMSIRYGASGNNLTRLQAIWLHRMVLTPHPLLERLTLLLHDHFATSQSKVNSTALMARQHATIRRHALGDFRGLLTEMARDPAMLVWLDSTTNRKAHPNENYAREVMELFTLGRGHYSEADIREAARAFTGSFVRGDRFQFVAAQHDGGEKTLFGRTGRFGGDDVAAILLDQPACAEYLAGRLFRYFVSEVDEPSEALLAPLAASLREAGYDLSVPVGMILRSRLFFDPAMRRRRVKCPVELAVGTIRALEILKPTVSSDALAEATAGMGQALFAPPSVAGWDWGASWINTTTSLARTNFALALLSADDEGLGRRFDPARLAGRHDASGEAGRFYADLLLQDGCDDETRASLSGDAREAATRLLASPDYQLA